MTKPLTNINVQSFRGATRTTVLDFDATKKLVVLFGENGTGKSTIIDALDALANGEVGSLEDRSSASAREHTHSIDGKPEKVKVTAEASDGSKWSATFRKGKFTVTPAEPRPRVRVLRRGQLLRLVASQPAKRYEELARFINVPGVEKSEGALLKACTDAESQLNEATTKVVASKSALENYWVDEKKPGKSALEWARAAVASPPNEVKATLALLTDVADALERAIKDNDAREQAQKAREAANEAAELASEAVKKEEAGVPASGLIKLLSQAKAYLAEPGDQEACPVCETPQDIGELRQSLDTRLEESAELIQLMKDRDEKEKKADRASTTLKGAETAMIKSGAALLISAKACDEFQVIAKGVDLSEFAEVGNEKAEEAERLSVAIKLVAALQPYKDSLSIKKEEHQNKVSQYTGIKTMVTQHDDNRDTALELEGISKDLKEVLAVVQDKRRKFAQKTLDEISAECSRLYEKIHPDENVGNIKLLLDENKRSSVDQSTDFLSFKGVPPQAYLSDSHLDTLGFCVWLAMAKKEDPANTILALDDIFSSADAGHLTRIVQLLADECEHFSQTIVATHYRQWRDRYRLHDGPGKSAQLLELHRWTLNTGVGLTTTKLAIDELEDAVGKMPLPRQAVGSQSGILLEGLLDRIAERYELRLPLRSSREYTLGELIDGSTKLFKKVEVSRDDGKGFSPPVPVLPEFDTVKALSFIRNQVGAHFNLTGADISDVDVESFGKATLALAKAVTCSACGQIPDRKAESYFRCSCKKCRISPNVRPS